MVSQQHVYIKSLMQVDTSNWQIPCDRKQRRPWHGPCQAATAVSQKWTASLNKERLFFLKFIEGLNAKFMEKQWTLRSHNTSKLIHWGLTQDYQLWKPWWLLWCAWNRWTVVCLCPVLSWTTSVRVRTLHLSTLVCVLDQQFMLSYSQILQQSDLIAFYFAWWFHNNRSKNSIWLLSHDHV